MIIGAIKHCVRVVVGLVLLALLALAGFTYWVSKAPRSVSWLEHELEGRFDALNSGYTLDVGDAVIKWDGFAAGLNLHLQNVVLKQPNYKRPLAELPDVIVVLDMEQLITVREVKVNKLTLSGVELVLHPADFTKNETLEPLYGPQPASMYESSLFALLAFVKSNNGQLPFDTFRVENSTISMVGEGNKIKLNLGQMDIRASSASDGTQLNFTSTYKYDEVSSHLDGGLLLKNDGSLKLDAHYTELNAKVIAKAIPTLNWLENAGISIDGTVKADFKPNGMLKEANFTAWNDVGLMEGKMPLEAEALKRLAIKGRILIHAEVDGNKNVPEIFADGVAYNLPVTELQYFWPPSYQPPTRQWVMTHIKAGMYKHASTKVHVAPKDVITGSISEGGLFATVDYAGVEADYLPGMPIVRDAAGSAQFDWNNMFLHVAVARVRDSLITDVEVVTNDFENDTRFTIGGNFNGSAVDLLAFMDQKGVDAEGKTQLDKLGMKGSAEGTFSITFPFKPGLNLDDVELKLDAELEHVEIPKITKDVSITGGALKLVSEKKEVVLSGTLLANNHPLSLRYSQYISEAERNKGKAVINTKLDVPQLPLFGIAIPENLLGMVQGSLGITAEIADSPESINYKVVVDTADAALDVPFLAWKKPVGETADISAGWNDIAGEKILPVISGIEAEKIRLKSKGTVSRDMAQVKLETNLLTPLDNATVNVDYKKDKSFTLDTTGKVFNLAPWINFRKQMAEKEEEEAEYSNLSLNARLDRLILDKGVMMDKVNANIHCDKERCNKVYFRAEVPGAKDKPAKQLSVDYSDDASVLPSGGRRFAAHLEDTGAFLQGFGISDTIRNGVLDATATEPAGQAASGGMILKDFNAVKAPLLAKLLTVTSFTGIVSLLNGEGIAFEKLDARFSYEKSRLQIQHLKMYGSQVGITAKGALGIDEDIIAISGAIIPAYTLNSILGNIPLIGNLIVGKEGEGIIATRYSMEGKLSDPQVSVNPLSMLTPGFLRNIWQGQEELPPQKEAAPKAN